MTSLMNVPQAVRSRDLPILAIVVPCYNEEASIPDVVSTLLGVLDRLVSNAGISPESFLYFIDDGSSDNGWNLVLTMHAGDRRVRGLKLSRNFGHQNALLAGLMSVKDRCDASVSIDADLQQDPNAIDQFVTSFKNGAEIVFGIRRDRSTDGILKHATALAFYRLMNVMGVTVIPNHADYRLLSRKAMNAVAEHTEPDLFLRAICSQLGFKSDAVYFDVAERKAGVSKYSLAKMVKLAINGITAFSVVPLRIIAVLGFLIFASSIFMALYIVVRTLLIGDTVPGWASTTLPIYFLGGIQILCMGVMGEYLAQVVSAVKRRPRFISDAEIF